MKNRNICMEKNSLHIDDDYKYSVDNNALINDVYKFYNAPVLHYKMCENSRNARRHYGTLTLR